AEVVGTGVLELALRLRPQRPGDGGQLVLGRGREVAQRGAGQPPPLGRRDPEERELVAHVGRGARRPLGVGGGLVGGAQPRDDLVRQRAHGRATAATARPGHPAAGRTSWSTWRSPRTSLMTLIATRAPSPAVMIVWTLTPATVPAAQMPGTEVRPSASTDTICLMRGSVPGTVATPAASASLTLVPVARMTWAAVSSRPSASRTVKAPALPSTASAAPSIQVAPDFSACSRPRATSSGPLMPSGSPRWLFTSARRVIPLSSSTTTVDRPARAVKMAALAPAGPPPMITTSLTWFLLAIVAPGCAGRTVGLRMSPAGPHPATGGSRRRRAVGRHVGALDRPVTRAGARST